MLEGAVKQSPTGSGRSRPSRVDVLLIAVVIAVAVLAAWALFLLKDDAPTASTPTADVACDLLRPRGMAPSTWFAADGTTTLTRDEAGSIAVTLGARANFDPQDTDARLVSDVLARIAHRRPGPPLTTDQRAAVARLDQVIRGDCS